MAKKILIVITEKIQEMDETKYYPLRITGEISFDSEAYTMWWVRDTPGNRRAIRRIFPDEVKSITEVRL